MRRILIDPDRRRLLKALSLSCILYGILFAAASLVPAWIIPPSALPAIQLTLAARPAARERAKSRAIVPEILPEPEIASNPVASEGEEMPNSRDSPDMSEGERPFHDTGDSSTPALAGPADQAQPRALFLAWLDSAVKDRLVYPDRARRRNITGTVYLFLVVAEDGKSCTVTVSEGSGSSLLDRAATELVKSLFPSPIAPGRNFAENIQIQYNLE